MTNMFNSKKAGKYQAGVLFVVCVFYFVILILTVNASEEIRQEIEQSTEIGLSLDSFQITGFIGQSNCANPRYKYGAVTGQPEEFSNSRIDTLDCSESNGVLAESVCNNIEGCLWDTVTSGFWFWEKTSTTCIGVINASFYGVNTTTNAYNETYVTEHDNTQGNYILFGKDPSPCNHPNVLNNETSCSIFSCTWESIKVEDSITKPQSIYSTVGDIFTFRYNFDEDNETMNFILNFIAVFLPLLLLLVSIYYMLPVVH